ncbi:hypothetical protein FDUTEX481_02612 [Tolypothrix sp. PCC 7601]|nr:hypothetical protein FDUTEX481_02612 [Tolypothrix sp. PCC 7601]
MKKERNRWVGRGTAPIRYLICQKIVDAVPLQRIYLSVGEPVAWETCLPSGSPT